jgi:protease-4
MPERILVSDLIRNARLTLANRLRLFRRRRMDYVVLPVSGSFPERTLRPRRPFPLSLLPWPPSPLSVEELNHRLDHLAADPRVQGAVLKISGLSAGAATLSSLRQAVLRFRKAGKRAVAYTADLSMWSYYLASACDEIVTPESADFRAAGLWSEAIFLRDTLALVGIEADIEAIAEYKVTPDTYRRAEMTEPHRKMLESILDSVYDEVVGSIASERGWTAERVREMFDAVPLTARQACDAGLVDALCYEDELAAHLGTPEAPAALFTWDVAERRLVRPRRWHSRRAIGVISLEGLIVSGASRRPPMPLPLPLPLPSAQAGSETLAQQVRAAARDRRLAAVVLHIDSPGGSALASDIIGREVEHLRRSKPVVVYMGDRAASGGYYVSAPASAIVAQPLTLTGSIGIWGGKIVTARLYEKIRARREVVSRGKAAGLYSDGALFGAEERAKIRADLGAGYARFKARVASGRGMTEEEVEAIARGRVWTGAQALEHGLVDTLGDLQAAADKARELAGVDPRRFAPLVAVSVPKRAQLSPAAPEGGEWLAGLGTLLRERVFALAPWTIQIRG